MPTASECGGRACIACCWITPTELGVQFCWGARVDGLADNGVMVDGQMLRCRWIVGADGQNSVDARVGGTGYRPVLIRSASASAVTFAWRRGRTT